MKPNGRSRQRQQGVILIISLIMLVTLTLIAVTVINLSTVNLRIVNNMQVRLEATSSAQRMIDRVISQNFSQSALTINAVAATTSLAVGGQTYDVQMARPCVTGNTSTPLSDLVHPPSAAPPLPGTPLNGEAQKCVGTRLVGPLKSSVSECSTVRWQLRAQVSDSWFGARTSVCQAAGVRTDDVLAGEFARVYACVAATDNC